MRIFGVITFIKLQLKRNCEELQTKLQNYQGRGKGGMQVSGGKRSRDYNTYSSPPDSCFKGNDESHFNVSLIVRVKVTRQSPYTTTFEDQRRAEAGSNRSPSLTPYRWAKPAHISRKATLFRICYKRKSESVGISSLQPVTLAIYHVMLSREIEQLSETPIV